MKKIKVFISSVQSEFSRERENLFKILPVILYWGFSSRLFIWNPGTLPSSLSLAQLKGSYGSIPFNPLLAEPMYLTGYIERLGSGTRDLYRLSKEAGLKEPEFRLTDGFTVIIWRPTT